MLDTFKNTSSQLNDMIDLLDDDKPGVCESSVIFWERWLTVSGQIAMIILDRYKDADDYFKNGFNATARNRMRFAEKKGYTCKIVSPKERNDRLQELHEINISKKVRQGNAMREGYTKYPSKMGIQKDICDIHFSRLYGLFKDNKWVGYISGVYCGELGASSQILGHGDYMKDDGMNLLWYFFIKDIMENIKSVKYVVYSRWSDGTEGLKYWKHSIGMVPITYTGHKFLSLGML